MKINSLALPLLAASVANGFVSRLPRHNTFGVSMAPGEDVEYATKVHVEPDLKTVETAKIIVPPSVMLDLVRFAATLRFIHFHDDAHLMINS